MVYFSHSIQHILGRPFIRIFSRNNTGLFIQASGSQKQDYVFRKTTFDDYFDEEGNFIGPQNEGEQSSGTMDHT